MPIPTDTYWNMKRLNVLFAVSAIVLMGTMGWAVFQDYNQGWRQPQRDAKVWEAALVEEKIDRETTPEKEAHLRDIQKQIDQQEKDLAAHHKDQDNLQAQIKKLSSDQTVKEFQLNKDKALLTVDESQWQDAVTAKTKTKAQMDQTLEPRRKQVEQETEGVWKVKSDIAEAKEKLATLDAAIDSLEKQKKKLTEDADSLTKKLNSLQANNPLAKLSNVIRSTPLMQFINPAEKVQQIVLPEIQTDMGGFKKVETVDRCMTCHVNITRKEYTLANVLAYLEEQVATARNLQLPAEPTGKSSDAAALRSKPGAVAMPEFWHLWGVRLAPELVHKQLTRLNTLAKTIGAGKPIRVTIGGKPLDSFNYVPDPSKKEDGQSAALPPEMRDLIMAEVIKTWIGYGNGRPMHSNGAIGIKIAESTTDKDAVAPRLVAMKYVEDLRTAMQSTLPSDTLKLLNDRYRRALIAEVNVARRKQGLAELDPSPALLAHPRLDLYVDVDSPHSFEAVGCTSCHDGSGQETNFVLAAHMARPIWVDQKTGAPVLPVQLDKTQAPHEREGGDLSSMLTAVYPEDALVPSTDDIHLTIDEHSETSAAKPQAATKPSTTQAAKEEFKVPAEPPENVRPTPYYDPVTGATGRAVSQMQYWEDTYEPSAPRSFELVYHEWDWPMRTPKYLQANCVRCHTDVNSIKDEAPQVFEGRSLFINLGCANCHQMDSLLITAETPPPDPSDIRLISANSQRKVGTDLRNITSKLSPAYINTWIWAPKAFRPSTKMPHFFMLENNSSDEELRRTRQEARSITEYLTRTTSRYIQTDATGQPLMDKSGDPIAGPLQMTPIPSTAKGSAEAGQKIFTSIGCQGCHTNTNLDTSEKRNGKPITLGEKWIVTDLVKDGKLAKQIEAETGKPADTTTLKKRADETFDRMTYNERQLYLAEHLAPDYSGTIAKYPDGTAKPVFQHHGPELSGIGTKLLAGRTPEQARVWVFNWVKQPRHYSEYTVMPNLRLSDQQALDLTEYLLAQKRDDLWKAELTPPDSEKLTEMTALFLRSRYSALTALQKADDDAELTALATDALTTATPNETNKSQDISHPIPVTADQAKAEVAKLSKDQKRMVFLGKKLIGNYGCMGCHAINGTENISSPCANLSDWGQKGVDKLDFGYLDHHKLAMIEKGANGEPKPQKIPMVDGLCARASLLTGAEWRADAPDGKIAKTITVDWPEVAHNRNAWITAKLKNTRVFDRGQELKEPDPKSADPMIKSGRPYDKLKMPTFYLNDREVDALVTWVISNRDRLISPKLAAQTVNEQAQRIARGRALTQKFNCVGCHQTELNTPPIQQYYKPDQIPAEVPPSLRGEGNKIQHTWLFNFLKNVEPLRPKLFNTIRMPSFPILDEEATDVAAYFNSLSNKEAEALDKKLLNVRKYVQTQIESAMKLPEPALTNPTTMPADRAATAVNTLISRGSAQMAQHDLTAAAATLDRAREIAEAHKIVEQVGATTKPVADRLKDAVSSLKENRLASGIMQPGEDWFTKPEFAQPAQELRDWALETKQISELQLDPTKNKPIELARNWHLMLFTADFVSELYKAPYPFVDTPRPEISEERFKRGEKMFYEMQCLKCHVLGDPNKPGSQEHPTAPNLALASRRLQRRWIRHWVQEPPIIQVNTAMPPFFSGKGILDPHGQSWPRAQTTERPAEEIEADFGKTVDEQTKLLLDFVYAAGVRGYTGIQPAAPPPSAKPAKPKVESAPTPTAPKPEAPKAAPKTEAPKVESAKPQAVAGAVSIVGSVKLEGKSPEVKEIDMSAVKECAAKHPDPVPEENIVVDDKGNLKNVVVYVSSGLSGSFDPPKQAAVINQTGCMYQPHVLPIMVGQQLDIQNSDNFLHNVHSLSMTNPPFNFGQPTPGIKGVDPLKAAETFHIKCDVHPWMSAYIVCVDNPFFAASGDDGKFSIANLPPGDYTLTAWHEQLGTKEIPVKVEAGKPTEVKITFSAQ